MTNPSTPMTPSTLESALTQARRDLRRLHRYTVTSEGASKGYFRLVEDATHGAWVTYAEIVALYDRLSAALAQAEIAHD